MGTGNYSATSNNIELVHLPLAAARPGPSSLYQIYSSHPSTAIVPITVLLYNGPLLCGFNVPNKGLISTGIRYGMTIYRKRPQWGMVRG